MGFDCSFQVSRNVCIRTVGSTLVVVDQFLLIGIGIRNKKKDLWSSYHDFRYTEMETGYDVWRQPYTHEWRMAPITQGSLCLTARASRNSHFVNVSVQVARIPLSSSLVSSVIQRVHTKEGLVCRPHTSSTNTAAPMYIHTAKWTSHRNVFATSFVSSVLFYCQLTLSRSLLFFFVSFHFVFDAHHVEGTCMLYCSHAVSFIARVRVVCYIMPVLSQIELHHRRRLDLKLSPRKVSAHGRVL